MCRDKSMSSLNRRQLLRTLGTLGVSMMVVRCASDVATSATSTGSGSDGTTGGGAQCVVTATETNGPFPADGSNSAGDGSSALLDDVYAGSPIIRSNITSDTSNGNVIAGVPLNLVITLQNTNNACDILAGYYVYVWHCTPGGRYSAYSGGNNGGAHARTETYLRGIQQTDASGQATFSTVYPGWYNGRAVHVHAEIYRSLSDANPLKITQMAFPMAVNQTVQATSGYPGTAGMMANTSDGIFADGTSTEMLSVTGDTTNGYLGSITFRVAA